MKWPRAKNDAQCLASYGCTREQWRSIGQKARRAFTHQKDHARRRGIGWELSLWEWWMIWQESGRWHERGRGEGYVMCRKGDLGPYAVGNIYIATGIQNLFDAKKHKDLPTGVRRDGGRLKAVKTISGRKIHLGFFATVEQAGAAYRSVDANMLAKAGNTPLAVYLRSVAQ